MRFAHGRYRGTSMSVCMIVGQDRQSRLTAGTKMAITKILRMLFEEKGVTYFCVMGNNDFERDCYYEMKQTGYMVLQDKTLGSFVFNKPTKFEIEMLGEWAFCENNKFDKFVLPYLFDESEYLLDKYVPPRAAIIETNKRLALKAGYILSGVDSECWKCGGAYIAVEYGRKHGKTIISIFS